MLECSPPKGFPDPVVSWKKDDQELKITDDRRLSLHPDGNLVIEPVGRDSEIKADLPTSVLKLL